ncbi:MAG: heme exporter protein CcmB [Alphaproteobacteria bacterium]
MRRFRTIVRRDVRLALKKGGDTVLVLAFFVLAVTLFPLGVGPDPAVLARISAGTIWVAALLAATLSLDRLFRADHEDGSLELLALAPLPLELTVLAKCVAHWLTSGLPLVVASPLLAVLMNMDAQGMLTLILALALGTPVLSLVGGIGAALTVGLRRGGVLLSLVVLPLAMPVLIFGVAAVEGAIRGLGGAPSLIALAGLLLLALALTPFASAAALRLALE